VVIPLIHPEALPAQRWVYLIPTPPPPPPATPVERRPTPRAETAVVTQNPFTVPTQIPRSIVIAHDSLPPGNTTIGSQDLGPGAIGGDLGVLPPITQPRVVVRPEAKTTTHIPSNLAAGLLIYKPIPRYPPIALVSHQQGTVVLAATISKDGTIINLHVVSGPAMFQGAAVDAVRNWRYRPYMLNGEPVDVETTINVNFTLGG
jgi:protein TonB